MENNEKKKGKNFSQAHSCKKPKETGTPGKNHFRQKDKEAPMKGLKGKVLFTFNKC